MQDNAGNTVAHLAIQRQDKDTLDLLLAHPDATALTLRNATDQTPLAVAMGMKYNKAAEAVCRRLPHAALQVDPDGFNLLHLAVRNDDFESVLFLLGLQMDVNIPTDNFMKLFPLHLSARHAGELVTRNLLLAGADPNNRDAEGRTALHYAAASDRAQHCQILAENGADPNLADHEGNNRKLGWGSRGLHRLYSCVLIGSVITSKSHRHTLQHCTWLSWRAPSSRCRHCCWRRP